MATGRQNKRPTDRFAGSPGPMEYRTHPVAVTFLGPLHSLLLRVAAGASCQAPRADAEGQGMLVLNEHCHLRRQRARAKHVALSFRTERANIPQPADVQVQSRSTLRLQLEAQTSHSWPFASGAASMDQVLVDSEPG